MVWLEGVFFLDGKFRLSFCSPGIQVTKTQLDVAGIQAGRQTQNTGLAKKMSTQNKTAKLNPLP